MRIVSTAVSCLFVLCACVLLNYYPMERKKERKGGGRVGGKGREKRREPVGCLDHIIILPSRRHKYVKFSAIEYKRLAMCS